MFKHKVLVIGSKGHARVECVDWLEEFPNIEDYDAIIINLLSLSQQVYDKAQLKISAMRNSVFTILNTGREIFCIFAKPLYPSPPPLLLDMPNYTLANPSYVTPSSYNWSPFKMGINGQKSGSSFYIRDVRFSSYLNFVSKWEFEIEAHVNCQNVSEILVDLRYPFFPIAVNKSQRAIAGSLRMQKSVVDTQLLNGAIHFLPPPTKASSFQAVETIIDLIIGKEIKVIQPWRKSIEVPFEKTLEVEIEAKVVEINNTNQKISDIQVQIRKWDSYRDLLSETGESLEMIVKNTLSDLGINTRRTDKGFPADLIGDGIAVEITGIKGFIGASSEKVAQIGRYYQNYRKNEKIIFIVNTFMDLPPQERKGKMNFSDPMVKYLDSLSVCYMTTETLFNLWKEVILGKREQKTVREKILKTIGEINA